MSRVKEIIEDIKYANRKNSGILLIEDEVKIELLRELLEKQIPKWPVFQDNDHETWGECPLCGESIPEYVEENETECYCLSCGQKLSWGD